MRGRKAAGCQQLVAVLRQLLGGLRTFLAAGVDEALERGLGMVPALGHPDLLQRLLGPGLDAFGQDVQDAARLAQPAAPVAGVRIRLVERGPEPQGPVADRHQGAQLDILGAKPAADPVGPDAGPATVGQIGLSPSLHLPVPLLRRARHARGRESLRLGPQQNLQGLDHLAAGTPLSYSRGTNAPTLAALRTCGGTGADRNAAGSPVQERVLGIRTDNGPAPVKDLATRLAAASHRRLAAVRHPGPVVAGNELADLGLQRQHPPGALAMAF